MYDLAMAARMHRTQVYLEQELVDGLQHLARREGTSMGELIRRGARQVLDAAPAIEPWSAEDPIWELLGTGEAGGTGDVSQRVDEILYGSLLYEEMGDHKPGRLRIAEDKAPPE
jgi:hypothetical protein